MPGGIDIDRIAGDGCLGHRHEEQAAEILRIQLAIRRLVDEKIGLGIEGEDIDAAPASRPAALGLPALIDADLRNGDAANGVDRLVVNVNVLAILALRAGIEIDHRLDDVPQPLQIEQVGLNRVIDFPKRRRHAHAGAG